MYYLGINKQKKLSKNSDKIRGWFIIGIMPIKFKGWNLQ